MFIGLEATRANRQHKTGTEWYAWHLLQQFKQLDHHSKFNVYYNRDLVGQLKQTPANFNLKRLYWPFGKLWTHIRLSWELLWHPVDKFFASNAVPLIHRGELTVTVHDLGFFRNPELYHPLERIYHQLSHSLAIRKADKIIAVSKNTQQDIVYYFPQAAHKVKVIYNGFDSSNFRPAGDKTKTHICNKYNLPQNFILYIGRLEAKKNVATLVKAYQTLQKKDWPLVLAGRPGNYGYDQILKLADKEDKQNKIKLLGYVPQDDYQQLIAAASLFVFPSKFEGFGIPVLEAMASGVPVVCSDLPVLKEVAGDAAVYFNPHNIEELRSKIESLINHPEKRKRMIELGLERVQQFSWRKCAKETLDYVKSEM